MTNFHQRFARSVSWVKDELVRLSGHRSKVRGQGPSQRKHIQLDAVCLSTYNQPLRVCEGRTFTQKIHYYWKFILLPQKTDGSSTARKLQFCRHLYYMQASFAIISSCVSGMMHKACSLCRPDRVDWRLTSKITLQGTGSNAIRQTKKHKQRNIKGPAELSWLATMI